MVGTRIRVLAQGRYGDEPVPVRHRFQQIGPGAFDQCRLSKTSHGGEQVHAVVLTVGLFELAGEPVEGIAVAAQGAGLQDAFLDIRVNRLLRPEGIEGLRGECRCVPGTVDHGLPQDLIS